MRQESVAYLDRIEEAGQQTWNLSETALQHLVLPYRSADPLPQYADQAKYLHPSHCRVCLQECDDLEEHLRAAQHPGATSKEEYRHLVLRKASGEWPQPITPQVLRCRLTAFKLEMTDDVFKRAPCACCARLWRQCKLTAVRFPPPSEAACPGWLPWSDEEWVMHREAWYNAVDAVLSTESYLRDFFRAGDRVRDAARAVDTFEDGATRDAFFLTKAAAESWLRRVKQWKQNMRSDLQGDSVPAPGNPDRSWLLFRTSEMQVESDTGTISCHLCQFCLGALSAVTRDDAKSPKVRMPSQARANGLWHGPDPPELSELSYCESKVINLARIYVSVKRVFLDRGSYASTSRSEAPMYHQKNVVAYPQNPDAALRCVGGVGLSPEALARTVLVQFVGGTRQALRLSSDLQVSVRKLRRAFHWLSDHSWPFMEATKQRGSPDDAYLLEIIETTLQQYESSVGTVEGGVPAELIQAASRIPAEKASVVLQGPTNCTDAGATESTAPGEDGDDDVEVQCAAAVDGGFDACSPLRLWDDIMKNYKVAQACEKELQRLDEISEKSKIHELKEKEAQAVAEAVQGIAKLRSTEVRAELEKFKKIEEGEKEVLNIEHGEEFLKSSDPFFWCACFMRLFPRGDCAEKCPERVARLSRREWAKCLIMRADFKFWRLDVEFVASLYNIR